LSDVGRRIREAILQISTDRQITSRDDLPSVVQRLVASDLTIPTAQRGGESTARRSERMETQKSQQARRSGVPWIWQQQPRPGLMQGDESVVDAGHAVMVPR